MKMPDYIGLFNEEDRAVIEKNRTFFDQITIKLEPVLQVSPGRPHPFIFGFEALGCTSDGQGFSSILEETAARKISPELPRTVLLAKALHNIDLLSLKWRVRGGAETSYITFMANLDHVMLAGNYLHILLDRWFNDSLRECTVFEISPSCSADDIPAIKKLMKDHGIRIALDDGENMPPEIKKELYNDFTFVKINAATGLALLKDRTDSPATLIDQLESYRIHDKPLIIEGVETDEWSDLLYSKWNKGALWAQGYGIFPYKPYSDDLIPLKNISGKGGYLPKE